MSMEPVETSPGRIPAVGNAATLPELVERAGSAARFDLVEFSRTDYHDPHAQRVYQRAVRRFLARGRDTEMHLGNELRPRIPPLAASPYPALCLG